MGIEPTKRRSHDISPDLKSDVFNKPQQIAKDYSKSINQLEQIMLLSVIVDNCDYLL